MDVIAIPLDQLVWGPHHHAAAVTSKFAPGLRRWIRSYLSTLSRIGNS
jgi:hypothetical protein